MYFRNPNYQRSIVSNGWWDKFQKRHSQLSIRTPSLIDPGRASMSRGAVMDEFYGRVGEFLTQLGIENEPDRIYNIDETWFSPRNNKLQNAE